jgi:hypothetical protein
VVALAAEGKDKDKGKGKATKPKGKKAAKGAGDANASALTLAGHPRAVRSVARAKSWGGLIGFALGGYLSLRTHTVPDAGLRALAAGLGCYVATWAAAVFLWRRLVVAELSHARQQLIAAELAKRDSSTAASTTAQPASSPGRA